jgi:hypothetical protein
MSFDLLQGSQFGGKQRHGLGTFTEGEACGGAGFNGIGLFAAKEGGAIVLVALRIAARDGNVIIGDGTSI